MTTNNEHPNRNNQIRPFVLTSHTEDGDEHIYTTLVVNP